MARVTGSKTVKKSKKVMRQKLQEKRFLAGQKKKKMSSKVVSESVEDQDLASSSDSEEIYISRKKMNSKDELHTDVTEYSSDASEEDKAKKLSNDADMSSSSESNKILNSEKRGHIPKKSKILKEKINAKKSDYTFTVEKKSIASPKKGSENSKFFDIDASPEQTKLEKRTKELKKVKPNKKIKNQIKELNQTKLKKVLKLTPAKTLTKAEKSNMFRKLLIKDDIISTVYEPKLTKEELKKQYEDKVNTKLTEESSKKFESPKGLKEFNQGETENSSDASEESEGDTESLQPKRKKHKVLESLNSEEPANVKKFEKSESAENEDLLTQPLTSKSPKKIKNSDKNKKQSTLPSNEDPRFRNTIFVGNLPVDTNKKALTQLFQQFRPISSRIRGVVASKQQIPKKVAAITGKYHPGLQSVHGYVAFETEDEAKKALSLNGTEFKDHHIRVDLAIPKDVRKEVDREHTVFVGNLPYDIGDEAVYSHFSQFGPVDQIRVIRDKETGVGKGFGYVQFKSETSREKAIRSAITEINERKVRIKPHMGTTKSFQAKDKRFRPARKPRKFAPKKKDGLLNEKKSMKKKIKGQKMQRMKKKIAAGFKAVMKD